MAFFGIGDKLIKVGFWVQLDLDGIVCRWVWGGR